MNEEIEEMITILKGIQKHKREMYTLTQRAGTMCPELMDYLNPQTHELRSLISSITGWHFNNTFERDLKRVLQQLEASLEESAS